MNLNEDKNYTEPTATEPTAKAESKKMVAWEKTLIVGGICFCVGMAGPIAVGMGMRSTANKAHQRTISELKEENRSLKKQLEELNGKNATVPANAAKPSPSAKATVPTTSTPAADKTENTYDHNEYYDIVESSSYKNSINHTILIDKVLAKKDVSVSGTILAYGEDGGVLGKSSDEIVLTAGQYNYFRYSFNNDVSNASFQMNAQAKEDSITVGERNAVEMVQYNQTGNELYITFKQNVDKLGYFSKFKLLFYKNDKIVETEDGTFSVYAENLNGNGITDVAKIHVFDLDYDRFEYIFEP